MVKGILDVDPGDTVYFWVLINGFVYTAHFSREAQTVPQQVLCRLQMTSLLLCLSVLRIINCFDDQEALASAVDCARTERNQYGLYCSQLVTFYGNSRNLGRHMKLESVLALAAKWAFKRALLDTVSQDNMHEQARRCHLGRCSKVNGCFKASRFFPARYRTPSF